MFARDFTVAEVLFDHYYIKEHHVYGLTGCTEQHCYYFPFFIREVGRDLGMTFLRTALIIQGVISILNLPIQASRQVQVCLVCRIVPRFHLQALQVHPIVGQWFILTVVVQRMEEKELGLGLEFIGVLEIQGKFSPCFSNVPWL